MEKIKSFNIKSFFTGITRHVRQDVLSGFIVSLIALPLCLGVASASNFPPITGVVTAIIGGLVIGFISGSELAIKGPAAGLIVIVAGAVEEYDSLNPGKGYLLAASLIAVTGLMQIVLGVLKIGKWADFIPSSIIHGILAAIGIIIISKQIHLLIGITPAELKGMEPVELIKKIPQSFLNLEWRIAVIGAISLALLFFIPRISNPVIKSIPPFLIVIIIAVLVAQAFHLSSDKYKDFNPLINPGQFEFSPFFTPSIFHAANFSVTLKYFFLLTIIGTIESMLTVKAVDLLDPYKRTSNYNKDIVAIGIGNLLAGLLGALPMISEVARSSANINNKGVTRLSSIVHGLFLVLFILIFVSLIKLIPVAALSSILVFVGWKLCHPKEFFKAYRVSLDHFIIFITTAIITVAVDMLVGVACGILLKTMLNYLRSGELVKLFRINLRIETSERQQIIFLDKVAVFTNWLAVKNVLQKERGKRIVVDFSDVKLIDSCFIENVSRFKESSDDELILRGFRELSAVKDHPYSMRLRSHTTEVVTIKLKPEQVELKSFCEENGFIVSFSTVTPRNYFASFKSFRHSDLRQTEIFATGKTGGTKFEYVSGMMYDSVDMLEFNINATLVEYADRTIPKFRMQRESKLDSVIEFLLKSQVVFENHPRFNSVYSVYSRERASVASIFSDEVISFFEQNDLGDIIIEGNGENKILIYNNRAEHGSRNMNFMLTIASTFEPPHAHKEMKSDQVTGNANV